MFFVTLFKQCNYSDALLVALPIAHNNLYIQESKEINLY